MRKNNLMVILLLITMVVTVVLNVSYADYEEYEESNEFEFLKKVLIEPEYTTIYEDDEINIEVGFNEYPSADYNSFYIEFDSNIFELDLSAMTTNNGYKYIDYKTTETSNIIKYIFNYKITKKIPYSDIECMYFEEEYNNNKAVDEVVFSNIKLKTKKNVKPGVYNIYSGYTNSKIRDFLPITIINKVNTSNEIGDIRFSSCKSKCKALNAGRDILRCNKGQKSEKVFYENGEMKIYDLYHGRTSYYMDFDYNTIYTNDELVLKLNQNIQTDSYYLVYDDEKNEYEKYLQGGYKVIPFVVSFEKNIFDIDVNNIEIKDERYKLKDYKIITGTNTLSYVLYFELNGEIKTLFPIAEQKEFISWKIKSKDTTKPGTYYFEIQPEYNEEVNLEIEREFFDMYYPINIIEKNQSINSLKKLYLYPGSFGLSGDEIFIDARENKEIYTYSYSNGIDSIEYTNIICNKKCYVKNNGLSLYAWSLNNPINIEVSYEDGTNKKYKIINEISDNEKLSPITNPFYEIIIIGNGEQKEYQNHIDKIKNYILKRKEDIGYKYDYYDATYYNYQEFTDAEKQFLGNIIEKYNEYGDPLIFLLKDLDEFSNYIAGDFTDEELYKYLCMHFEIKYEDDAVANENNIVTLNDEYDNQKSAYNDNIVIIIIVVSLLLGIGILIILLKNKKKQLAPVKETLIQDENIQIIENQRSNQSSTKIDENNKI